MGRQRSLAGLPRWMIRAVPAALIAAAMMLSLAGPTMAAGDPACSGSAISRAKETLLMTGARLRQGQRLTILAIGSSSTEGAGASTPRHSYPQALHADLVRGLGRDDVTVVNAGIGGETALQTVERLERAVAERRYDLVIWQVGTNDAIRGEDEDRFRAILARGIDAIVDSGADVLMIDQQFFPKVKDPVRYERFVNVLNETAAERNVPVFNRYQAMQGWARQSIQDFNGMLAADGFHMSDRGYACVAQLIAGDLLALQGRPAVAVGARSPAGRGAAPAASARSLPMP